MEDNLLHYLIFVAVVGIVLFWLSLFTKNGLKSICEAPNDNDNKEKDAKKIEIEINNDKIIQKDSGEVLKVLKNISTEDITINNHENPPDEKQT